MVVAMLYPACPYVIAINRNFAVIAVNCTKYKLSSIIIIAYFNQDFCVGTSFKCLILIYRTQTRIRTLTNWHSPKEITEFGILFFVSSTSFDYRTSIASTFERYFHRTCDVHLTPQGQLSLQGTFGVWTDVKVLWTKADEGEVGMLDAEFYQLSYGVHVFWKFRKFFLGLGLSFICPWRIKFHLHMDHGIVETHLISNDLIASSILQDVTWQSK